MMVKLLSPQPEKGDTRTVRHFAFFPRSMSNGGIVWWEYYYSHQKYLPSYDVEDLLYCKWVEIERRSQ